MKNNAQRPYAVSIIIPNWNGKHLLEKNLPFVATACSDCEIIIADDASIDGSVAFLKKNFSGMIVVENTRQQGFAGNVNRGVARATGDIVVLLNSDVRPQKGFLEPLLRHFENANTFAVGCMEKSHENGAIVLRGRGVARWEKGYYVHARGEVDQADTAWVSGGSSAFRRSLWHTLGGMDTLYNPFYWEDIDLSYQAKKAGFRVFFEKKSVVEHFHEEGKIKTSYTPKEIKTIVYRNQFMFLWKNISEPRLMAAHIFWTPVRLIQAILAGDFLMLAGYGAAVLRLPNVVRSRSRASRLWKLADTSVPLA